MAGHFFQRKLPEHKKASLEIPTLTTKSPAKYGGGDDKHDDNKNKGKGNKLFQTFKNCKHDLFHLGPKKM